MNFTASDVEAWILIVERDRFFVIPQSTFVVHRSLSDTTQVKVNPRRFTAKLNGLFVVGFSCGEVFFAELLLAKCLVSSEVARIDGDRSYESFDG